MRQIGLALHNYHGVYGTFPPGYTWPEGSGWSFHILPFLDKTNIYNTIGITTPSNTASIWRTGNQEKSCATFIDIFRCPSDIAPRHINNDSIKGRVPCNYTACASGKRTTDDAKSAKGIGPEGLDGMFYRLSSVRFRDIYDGTSHTVGVGEVVIRMSHVDHWYIGSDDLGRVGTPDSTDASEFLGSLGGDINLFHDTSTADRFELSFKSRHAAGCHLLLMDGAVRFHSERIDADLRRSLGIRSGREVPEEF